MEEKVSSPLAEEARHWFALALPLAATLLCRTGMVFTDISVLGLWNSDYLGAAGVSGLYVSLTSVVIWRGLLETLNTLCAQAYGAGNYKLVGEWLGVGLTLSIFVSVIVGLSWMYAGEILQYLTGFDNVERGRVDEFCRISLFGLIPFILYSGLSNYLSTIHIVKPLLYINFVSLMMNLFLNLILVRGIEGWFDGLGFAGSPSATALTRTLVFIWSLFWIHMHAKLYPDSDIGKSWPKSIRSLFCAIPSPSSVDSKRYYYSEYMVIALPIITSSLLEEAQIQVVALMAARLGDKEIATHNAIFQVFFVFSSFMWATASTTQVRMSSHLGAGDTAKAKVAMRVGAYVALFCGGSIALSFIVARDNMASLFTTDPEIKKLTGQIASLVGMGYFGLSAFYVSLAVLSAQARPHIIAMAFFVGAWGVGVPSAYFFAFVVEQTKGLFGLWVGLICGYCVVTLLSVIGVLTSDWDKVTKDAITRSAKEISPTVVQPLLSDEEHQNPT